jgi:hypothetical protein
MASPFWEKELEAIKKVLRRWFPGYPPFAIDALAGEMLGAVRNPNDD